MGVFNTSSTRRMFGKLHVFSLLDSKSSYPISMDIHASMHPSGSSSLWGSCWLSAQYVWTKVVVSYFWWCSSVDDSHPFKRHFTSSGPLTYRFAGVSDKKHQHLHTENLASIAKLMVWKGHSHIWPCVVFGRCLYPRLPANPAFLF